MASRRAGLIVALICFLMTTRVVAQEIVHFPSLDDQHTMLDGYLYRPTGDGPYPAIVGLHGCSGMFDKTSGKMFGLYRAWARRTYEPRIRRALGR
jgi:dipeptidyl aminopeptidase/acylaminoacyl peptidase